VPAPNSAVVSLNDASALLLQKNYPAAIRAYVDLMRLAPENANLYAFNLSLARRRYRRWRQHASLRVGIVGCEMTQNSPERLKTLAEIARGVATTEIVSASFARLSGDLPAPVRDLGTPCQWIRVADRTALPAQAMDFVCAHPYDLVILSKPRFSNILIGLLYTMVWGARVIVDIDDEELGATQADSALTIETLLNQHRITTQWQELDGKDWSRVAVRLWDRLDHTTVSSPAAQVRNGGASTTNAGNIKSLSNFLVHPEPDAAGPLFPKRELHEVFDKLGEWRMFACPARAKRIIVYSVLVGDYEDVKEPEHLDPEARYILFTDNLALKSDRWEVVHFDTQGLSPRRASRLPKLLSHRYLPEHDISIYLDASLTIVERDVSRMAHDALHGHDIAAYPHFERDCVYDEIETCVRLGKTSRTKSELFRQQLSAESFPRRWGLVENAFLVRRNTDAMRDLNEAWYDLFSTYAERDQFYLMYLFWKRNLPYAVISNSSNFRKSPYVRFTQHNATVAQAVSDVADELQPASSRLITWSRKTA